MSLLASFALAAAAGGSLPQCSWDRPGVNPFMGDVVAAVDHYADIPVATRRKLQARMKARNYDDIALIERDGITGKGRYAPEIRDMHFGQGSICRTVTRTRWTAQLQERGLVYCEDGQCILVPTVCRNVSRIRRLEAPRAVAPTRAVNEVAGARASEEGPLEFEPPSAGPTAAAGAGAGAGETFASAAGVPSLTNATPTGGAAQGPSLMGGSAPTPAAPPSGGPGLVNIGMPALPPGQVSTTDTPPRGDVVSSVPEPSTWVLMALGLLLIVHRAQRRR
ncbi:MHFG family PEP-CTERM protein [Roseateles sp. BYS87W]|uniref:MHFG family PEP-CTERM protein n=1 Tax=Pelomonas baiyunensis TaxID=3299026 RepID=A0ABW7GZ69_9BURK